jgi:hypothetical protein
MTKLSLPHKLAKHAVGGGVFFHGMHLALKEWFRDKNYYYY